MKAHIEVQSDVHRSARVMQMEGMFDVPPSKSSHLQWDVDLPLDRPWQIGLIVGPSGSGKSTVAKHIWPEQYGRNVSFGGEGVSILDAFPEGMPIKSIIELLNSVGFSTPPAWVRPFDVLSTGEKFRVLVALSLAGAMHRGRGAAAESPEPELVVLDEFTSFVDRAVAQVGSAAIARTVRAHPELRLIGVTCHYDVLDWLQPDWTFTPATNEFVWRLVQPRPPIELRIVRVHHSAWQFFRHHHYLDTNLNHAATCWVAFWGNRPVCFSSWLSQPHGQIHNMRREHRTVTLPDFQGVGIGNAVSNHIASMWRALGYRPMSTTSHPAMVRSRARSPLWRMHRSPGRVTGGGMMTPGTAMGRTIANDRLTSGFEYVGPMMDRARAKELFSAREN